MTVSWDKDTKSYRYHFQLRGRRYVQRGFSTKQAANDAAVDRRRAIRANRTAPFPTFAALVKSWIAEGLRTKREDWVIQCQAKLNRWCEDWDTLRPDEITPADVVAVLQRVHTEGRRRKPRTVNEMRKILHAVFAYGVRLKALEGNPVTPTARMPESQEPLRPIATEHLRRLLVAATPRFQRLLIVMALTGVRWIGLARLQPGDLHLERGYCLIRSRKNRGGGERLFRQHLPAAAIEALRQQLADGASDTRVFPGPRGEQQHDAAMKRLRDTCKRAEIPRYGYHDIRRWAGSMSIAAGQPASIAQRLLGHQHLSSTQRYLYLEDPVVAQFQDHLWEQLGLVTGPNLVTSTGAVRGAVSSEKQ